MKYHNILLYDQKMGKVWPNPIKIIFRQAPNLKQRLVKSNLKALPFNNQEEVEWGGGVIVDCRFGTKIHCRM